MHNVALQNSHHLYIRKWLSCVQSPLFILLVFLFPVSYVFSFELMFHIFFYHTCTRWNDHENAYSVSKTLFTKISCESLIKKINNYTADIAHKIPLTTIFIHQNVRHRILIVPWNLSHRSSFLESPCSFTCTTIPPLLHQKQTSNLHWCTFILLTS